MKPLYAISGLIGLAALGFSAAVLFSSPENTVTAQNAQPVNVVNVEEQREAEPASQAPVLANPQLNGGQNGAIDGAITAASLFGTNLGGSFDLIDHFGEPRQLEDYAGKHVLVFFGYANCLAICSAALPLMADTINLVGGAEEAGLVPLMITVDPENDTPEFMREKLAEYHPSLIGMTGSEGQLADVRRKFQVRTEFVGTDIDGNPIYNHGSFIYLLGPDGKVKTLVPPILEPQQMANIIKKYLAEETPAEG